jgi:hypothetical protein
MNDFTHEFLMNPQAGARSTQDFCSTGLGPLLHAQKDFRAQTQAGMQLTICAHRRAKRHARAKLKNPQAPDAFCSTAPKPTEQNSAHISVPNGSVNNRPQLTTDD